MDGSWESKDDVASFLRSLDPSYEPYAESFWADGKGFGRARQIARSDKEDLLKLGVSLFHVGDIIAGASAKCQQEPAVKEEGVESKFRRLLSSFNNNPDPRVLTYLLRHEQAALTACESSGVAQELYQQAEKIPGSSTRLTIIQRTGYSLNGSFLPNVISRSCLLYAFKGTEPFLCKIPRSPKDAAEEVFYYMKASEDGDKAVLARNHLAGPLDRVALSGSGEGIGLVTEGLMMPLYAATLEHVPRPLTEAAALKVYTQVSSALDHLHSVCLGHNDVKAPNIFLDGGGDCYLGDYGAVRTLGAEADQQTSYMVPRQPPFNPYLTSSLLDKCLLAITLLEKLGLLEWERIQGPSFDSVLDQARTVGNQDLRRRLLELLQA